MDKYFYLSAQLPFLRFDTPPLLSREEFLDETAKWLSSGELRKLALSEINRLEAGEKTAGIYRMYQKFELDLRQQIAFTRGEEKGSAELKISSALQQILSEGDPLTREIKLLRLRWDFFEDLEQGHYFDLDFLIIYYLKLQILLRLFTFDKDKGTEIFDSVCEVKYG